MSNSVASCQLVCLQKTHDAINLPHGETVVIGRSPQTKIIDPRCSRNQLELTANWKNRTVNVQQKGSNPSAIDGKDIGVNCVVAMTGDSTLFILSSLFPHKVVFEPNVQKPNNNYSHQDRKKEHKVDESHKKIITSTKVEVQDKKKKQDKEKASSSTSNKNVNNGADQNNSRTHEGSKRHSTDTDTHEQEPTKKKIKTTHLVKSKLNETTNGNQLPSADKSSTSKITGHASSVHRSNSNEESDDDKHIAIVQAKLDKMKQAALKQSEIDKAKTASSIRKSDKTLSQGSSTSAQSLPSSKKTSESSSNSNQKTLPAYSLSPSEKASWDYHVDYYVYTSKGVVPSNKIAGFDLDGTVICTKSGKTFPENADDWTINMPEVFNKLKDLHRNQFKIVFFTNQLGVARGKIKIEHLMKKVENVIAKLCVPIQVFIATHEGRYRKPMTGMWEKLKSDYNSGLDIDTSASIYVGDAAGRQANWAPKKKKDFSCSDRLFALNIGIPFKTPEEFFQNKEPTSSYQLPAFDPRKLTSNADLLSGNGKLVSDSKEVIILVGFPASGKSHFATNIMSQKGYKVISRDTLGSWQKCVKRANETLVNSSVVIDNTNLTKDERARYVECAKNARVPCRCFVFTTTVEHCRHNERFRQMTTKSHEKINELIFNQIKKKYQEPSLDEGFKEIVKVNFVPRFSSDREEEDYRKFLLEK